MLVMKLIPWGGRIATGIFIWYCVSYVAMWSTIDLANRCHD